MSITVDDRLDQLQSRLPDGVTITGPIARGYAEILTPEALRFVALLSREFEGRRQALLVERARAQDTIMGGEMPDFPAETEDVRKGGWTIAPTPADLQDRRVEITGPVERKMMINALNSGASVFMADFEDACSPSWDNVVQGQLNVRDAILRTIEYDSPEGKAYRLNERTAVLFVRPRGWHLAEKHVLIDGRPVSASMFDFGLFFYHNAHALLQRGTGPYLYLPKLEHYLEARLWNDIFCRAQDELGIPRGTIKATVLVETILAAFQMDEILWELRQHSAGLNCGRWDYIFSVIKKFRAFPAFVLPDRKAVTMTTHMMRSYSLLCIKTCHRRGAHAIGGMAAFIPVKSNPQVNEEAIRQVLADKQREAGDGHDGTWVAHPGLVPVARDVFDELMPQANQINRLRPDVSVTAADLLTVPEGAITEQGVRQNVSVGIQYLESWLSGQGAAAINHLMEDVATAEISRAQLWQWVRHRARLADGRGVTQDMVRDVISQELDAIRTFVGEERFQAGRYEAAASVLDRVALQKEWIDFLTLVGYDYLP
ncbi:MAG TPA: malate synthase A [Anaerolineales bacterium]